MKDIIKNSPDLLLEKLAPKKKEISERIMALLKKGKLWDYVVGDELGKRIIGHIPQREIVLCFMMGRLIKNAKPSSLNLLMKGDSGSGKDWVVKNVSDLFPPQDIEYFGRATSKAFNYVHDSKEEPLYTYEGKVVYLEEITEKTLNDEVMKVWTSGKNRMVGVERGKSIIKEPKGKPVIIATSFSAVPNIEMLNRIACCYCFLTPEQKKKVKEQRLRVAKEGIEDSFSEDILDFFSLQTPCKVKIPYALKLSKHLPDEIQGESRTIDRIMEIIKSIAVFHQGLKEKSPDGFIDADERDYEITRGIIRNIDFGFPDFLLDEKQRKILEILQRAKEPLDTQEILDKLGSPMAIQNLRPHLQRLVDLKKIESIPLWNEKHYHVDKYQIIASNDIKKIELPPFEDL